MLEFSNSSRPASSRGGGGGARAFDRKMLVLSIFRGFRSLPKKKKSDVTGGQGLDWERRKFYARQVDGNMHAACITNKRDVSV
jgi:hypothetical protein